MKKVVASVAVLLAVSFVACAESTADIAARIKAREAARQNGEFSLVSKSGTGYVKFDHTKNNGRFTIYAGNKTFVTSWGGCFPGKIWAYRDADGLIGYKQGYGQFPASPAEFERVMDFSNRAEAVNVGDVVLFVNKAGDFLAVRLLAVKYIDRGDDEYCIEFEYKVY